MIFAGPPLKARIAAAGGGSNIVLIAEPSVFAGRRDTEVLLAVQSIKTCALAGTGGEAFGSITKASVLAGRRRDAVAWNTAVRSLETGASAVAVGGEASLDAAASVLAG